MRRSASSRSAVRLPGVKKFCDGALRGFRNIDLAFLQPLEQFVRRDVDEDDIRRMLQDAVGHGLAHGDAGDARDDIGQTFEMLDIERRPDVDAGVEQFLDVLPAFGMAAVGRVGVREFVDDDELGLARQGGVDVEFLEGAAAIFDLAARQDFQTFRQGARFRPTVRLDETDDDVDAVQLQGPRLRQHGVGLADAGRGAQKDAQLAARFDPSAPAARQDQGGGRSPFPTAPCSGYSRFKRPSFVSISVSNKSLVL